jgi:hypothetical protein
MAFSYASQSRSFCRAPVKTARRLILMLKRVAVGTTPPFILDNSVRML